MDEYIDHIKIDMEDFKSMVDISGIRQLKGKWVEERRIYFQQYMKCKNKRHANELLKQLLFTISNSQFSIQSKLNTFQLFQNNPNEKNFGILFMKIQSDHSSCINCQHLSEWKRCLC